MIEAGRLRYIVQIQEYTSAQDSSGDMVKTYDTFATVHAEIITSGGRELFVAQTQFPETSAIIKIRYLAGVNERMRVFHVAEGIYYDILNVRPDDATRKRELILTCKTGLSDEA